LCENDRVHEFVSPDNNLKAVLFRRSCGATTPFSTHISVLNRWQSLSDADAGNVYVQDHSDEFPDAVSVRWEGSRKLIVERQVSADSFTERTQFLVLPFFQHVQIEYRFKDDPMQLFRSF
jgi:hypothetical protein